MGKRGECIALSHKCFDRLWSQESGKNADAFGAELLKTGIAEMVIVEVVAICVDKGESAAHGPHRVTPERWRTAGRTEWATDLPES